MASRWTSICPTPSRAPGTRSSGSSGSRPPGSPPASTSCRPSAGAEPKGQRLGVNILFGALLLVVVGSMAGQWLSIKQMLPGELWFWFGHSGYEYIDLGKVWQIGLLTGLFLWLFLMARGIMPALRRRDEQRPILTLFLISSIAIARILRRGARRGAPHQPGDGGVLAMVGRPPLGGRVLRGLRDRRDRVPLRAARAARPEVRRTGEHAERDDLPEPAASSAPCITSISPARRRW